MSFKIVLQSEALLDIQEAFEWYEDQLNGLGYDFIEEIENCYMKLSAHPGFYTFINEKYRRIKTNRFPYLLVYEIDGDKVIINSVYHVKRKFSFE